VRCAMSVGFAFQRMTVLECRWSVSGMDLVTDGVSDVCASVSELSRLSVVKGSLLLC
jgi:hypothetical protein